jgi:hypothetical protein
MSAEARKQPAEDEMAVNRTFFERAKSVAGVVLAAIGMFILCQHLDHAASHLSHLLCHNQGDTPGPLPAMLMAALCVIQAYAADHQGVLPVVIKQMWISFWPLLLVMAGTILSRNAFTDDSNAPKKEDCGIVDSTASVRR